MSFDGSFTHAMVHELEQTVATGRVSKINQPYANEVVLTIRANGHNYPILLSANPTYARIQVTEIPYVNPAVPTNYTMILRKYLQGAILKGVTQAANDRVVHLHFTSRNELGDQQELLLIIEIMARHSNVILVEQSSGKILDAIKHVGSDQNRYRLLLPGAQYITPPKQDLDNPFNGPRADLTQTVKDYPNQEVLAQTLQHQYQGLGKDTAAALAATLHETGDLAQHFQAFFAQFDAPQPTLAELPNGKTNFTAFPYPDTTTNQSLPTLSQLLDTYYQDKAERDRVQQQGSVLIRVVRNELKKNRNKLKKLQRTLDATENADEYRIKGEILTTYLYKLSRGATTVTLPNFYDNEKHLKIALSNQLSPNQNAQKYFKRYQKEKNAVSYVTTQIKQTQANVDYFTNIMAQIELAAPKDLTDIRLELQQGGYLRDHDHQRKAKAKAKKRRKQRISQPDRFTASDGTRISVGKNNLQNDKLSLHTAKRTDIWLHVKDIPGSHVIIHAANPSEQTTLEAANLAAYYSKARDSSTVPVDYVPVKRLHKPNGAKPGFVIFTGQKTVFVTPESDLVDQLAANNPK
ncbi:NFACT RNA binding domain-containing protein [Levilactobacillus suantsaii]|uniref:Rqc2 homolog RqcH n=1 Tax=Levilactobacillus suantsaii TaxID=2292255 RepID=A0A4Q0VHZ2_9LACO|nr:NFACT RNA binding domain-containing protein [Levilactobacillus suantsaii]QMU07675.1 NFACT family protein [Levilactobacillus suantsaii]RXI78656.1 fibronectin/fibrinogen-binding protein [Levilactobacillus suantsaii]